jgi:hypothetical protein
MTNKFLDDILVTNMFLADMFVADMCRVSVWKVSEVVAVKVSVFGTKTSPISK